MLATEKTADTDDVTFASVVARRASVVLMFVPNLVTRLLLLLIRLYQKTLSPLLGPCCRFEPSCSAYAAGALKKHGLLRGLAKAIYRVARCNPLCKGGYDPP
jgi:putative membrane protein insertion efficiency factor